VKRATFARALALAAAALGSGAARPRPTPTLTPPPDPQAERLFARAKDWWRQRKEVPYATFGALIRYKHSGHIFDNWWDAAFRSKDGLLRLKHIAVPEDDAKRLKGFPITIFGFKIFDTNPDAEPIRLEDPQIEPTSDFGLLSRYSSRVFVSSEPTENPLLYPEPGATPLREVGRVEVATRDYDVRIVGDEELRYGESYHLKLTPLRDPRTYRLRDLWIEKTTYATMQLSVDGIFNGKPYDGVRWTAHYVPLGGRWYLQQLRGDNLRFGLDVFVQAMEIDFVDYHFPSDIPQHTFDKLL
jgi:hypothetical protein